MLTDVTTTKRETIQTVTVMSGDVIQLRVHDETGERVVLEQDITEVHTFDEAMIFEGQVDGRYALGGAFIEAER